MADGTPGAVSSAAARHAYGVGGTPPGGPPGAPGAGLGKGWRTGYAAAFFRRPPPGPRFAGGGTGFSFACGPAMAARGATAGMV